MGPLKLFGVIFGTIGTAAQAVERLVTGTDKLVGTGFKAIDIAIEGGMEELETDNIVEGAKRRVRREKANAEADEIIAKLTSDAGVKLEIPEIQE